MQRTLEDRPIFFSRSRCLSNIHGHLVCLLNVSSGVKMGIKTKAGLIKVFSVSLFLIMLTIVGRASDPLVEVTPQFSKEDFVKKILPSIVYQRRSANRKISSRGGGGTPEPRRWFMR